MADFKHFRWEKIDEVVVLHLVDAELFDRLIINEMQDEVLSFLKTYKIPKLLINFGAVRSLSSETLNALLKARDWIVGNDGIIKFCDMRDTIRQVFKVTNLDGTMFEIHDSMHEALDSF
jgi:anti-anti-sigma factor